MLKKLGSALLSGWLKVHSIICRVLNPLRIRGIVVKILLPWNEGFIVYPIDYGWEARTKIAYLTWGCFHIRIIFPFPLPVVPKASAPVAVATPDPSVDQPTTQTT